MKKIKELEVDMLISLGYIPIANKEELNNIRLNEENTFGKGTKWENGYLGGLDNSYIQVRDIEFSGNEKFEPLGPFRKIYNGGNYTIKNLHINREGYSMLVGLFSEVKDATLKNINVINSTIIGENRVGVIAGISIDSDIYNCNVRANMHSIKSFAGGIVGLMAGTNIEDCNVKVNIEAYHQSIGGIAGGANTNEATSYTRDNCSIKRCTVEGIIQADFNVGGVIGSSKDVVITDSYYNGKLYAEDIVGGIAGFAKNTEIYLSTTDGLIRARRNAGSLIGKSLENIKIGDSFGSINVELIKDLKPLY